MRKWNCRRHAESNDTSWEIDDIHEHSSTSTPREEPPIQESTTEEPPSYELALVAFIPKDPTCPPPRYEDVCN